MSVNLAPLSDFFDCHVTSCLTNDKASRSQNIYSELYRNFFFLDHTLWNPCPNSFSSSKNSLDIEVKCRDMLGCNLFSNHYKSISSVGWSSTIVLAFWSQYRLLINVVGVNVSAHVAWNVSSCQRLCWDPDNMHNTPPVFHVLRVNNVFL